MVEIILGGNLYRIGKLIPFDQLHLTRKLAPLVPELVPAFVRIKKMVGEPPADGGEAPKMNLDQVADIAQLLGPFTAALAGLSNEDTEYITGLCMGVVQRQSGNAWAAVWNKDAKAFMFQDIELDTMLLLLVRVIMANLGNFIRGLLTSPELAPAAA